MVLAFPARVHVLVSSQTHAKTIPYPATITGICGAGWDVLSVGEAEQRWARPEWTPFWSILKHLRIF